MGLTVNIKNIKGWESIEEGTAIFETFIAGKKLTLLRTLLFPCP